MRRPAPPADPAPRPRAARAGRALALALSLAATAGCVRDVTQLRMTRLKAIRITSLERRGFNMEASCEVLNPAPVQATLEKMKFSIYLGRQLLGQGTRDAPLPVQPGATFPLRVPLWVAYSDLPASLTHHMEEGKLRLRILGQMLARTSFGQFKITLDREELVQVDEALRVVIEGTFSGDGIKLQSLQLRQVDLQRTLLRLALDVRNPFPFLVRVQRATYSVSVGGVPLGQGTTPGPLHLPPRARREVPLELSVPHAGLGASALAMLRNAPRVRVEGTLWVDPVVGVTRIPLRLEADARVILW